MKTALITVVVMLAVAGHSQSNGTTFKVGTDAAHTQTVTNPSDLGTAFSNVAKDVHALQQGKGTPTSGTAPAPAPATKSGDHSSTAPHSAIWEARDVPGKKQSAAKPTPAAAFVLSNGDRVESTNYMVTTTSVSVEQNGVQRTIPLNQLNMDATIAANKARGVKIQFPTNKSQITLGF